MMITTWESVKRFPGVPKLQRSSPHIFMHFLPGISLLTLRRFVAEVRWLFPESRQKKRESGKQRNTEPWRWELNENTTQRFLKSVLRAHHFIAYIWSKSSAVPVYCLFFFACFFFLLWQYLCIFLFSVYARFKILKQGQKMNIPKINDRKQIAKKATKFYTCYHNFALLTVPDAFAA